MTAGAASRSSCSTGSARPRARSCRRWRLWPARSARSRSTSPASAIRTSRSARRYHAPFFARSGRRADGRARDRPGAPDRQQHGRSHRPGARAALSRTGRTDSCCSRRRSPGGASGPGRRRARLEPRARPRAGHAALGRRGDRAPHHPRRPEHTGFAPAWTSSCGPTSPRGAASPSMRRRARSTSKSRTARRDSGRASPGSSRRHCSSGASTTASCRSRSRRT